MAIPAILRGLSSLIPGLGGAAYVGSERPEGIEDMFKAIAGTTGISRASEDLTKEINVKKVADRLKAAGVDPETADRIAQGAIGQFGDAVIGDDEASTIAQDIGKGLEGGKPSGSAMIDFSGEEERGKMLKDPLITKPSEVGADIMEGFTESEGIAQLPPFTEQEEQKVNVGDVGFTEAKAMPTILTAGIAPEDNDSGQDTTEIIGTNSGVVINFADRKARDLELGGKSDANIGILERLGFFSRPNFGKPVAIKGHGDDPRFLLGFSKKDGSRGYAYGYLTDRNIAFVEQLNTPEGSFSPSEYKEIKDAVKEYTGADRVGGFRISGARSYKSEKIQKTIMKAAGGIVDRPLYD